MGIFGKMGLGYKPVEIRNLLEQIDKAYENLGEAIMEGWPALSNFLGLEWVGSDEVDYEAELANKIRAIYKGYSEIANVSKKNIIQAYNRWVEMQNTNRISGGTVGQATRVFHEILFAPVKMLNIDAVVKAPIRVFTESMDFGLMNGVNSANNINNSIYKYVNNVIDRINKLSNTLSSANGFFGSQSQEITGYLRMTMNVYRKIQLHLEDLQIILKDLIRKYVQQNAMTAQAFSAAGQAIAQGTVGAASSGVAGAVGGVFSEGAVSSGGTAGGDTHTVGDAISDVVPGPVGDILGGVADATLGTVDFVSDVAGGAVDTVVNAVDSIF
ncbi:MAG: hypothetical protein IKL65_02825 [Bacilli bacterium]|nr:hypothetical protein [Bacilli bacterium]